jgi:quercetin dioxygenase-like cupin family protein
MTKPESPAHASTHDLRAIAEELRKQPPYAREGHTARTLLIAPDLRVVLIAMSAGSTISEHHANATATVHVLTGHVRLQLPEERAEVEAGKLLVLPAGVPHDVVAETDSAFLLTLGWSS